MVQDHPQRRVVRCSERDWTEWGVPVGSHDKPGPALFLNSARSSATGVSSRNVATIAVHRTPA